MLSARLRQEHGWSDANILNVSSRGLMLHGSVRPPRGSYLEIRRGSCVIVGRVVWIELSRFGIRTQNRIPVDALISSGVAAAPDNRASPVTDRRTKPRSEGLEWRYVRSSDRGRAMQFAAIAAAGFLVSLFIFRTAGEALAAPLATVSRHLVSAG
jgi:hypothetical protein